MPRLYQAGRPRAAVQAPRQPAPLAAPTPPAVVAPAAPRPKQAPLVKPMDPPQQVKRKGLLSGALNRPG